MTALDWLLDSDPAIRWQVLRDLVGAPAEVVAKERARMTTEGWAARLLSLQGEDGQWAGGACFPRSLYQWDRKEGQPWISTLPTLQLLYDFGIDPHSEHVVQAVALVRDHCRWEHAGQPFFSGEVEPCINGRTVTLGTYFGLDMDALVTCLLGEQLADGGWNCETENGSVRSSFATTINVLEGLLAHERATGGSVRSIASRRRGEEYLLERRLFRRKSTGEVVNPSWLQFSFPVRWHYDVLRALEYFRTVGAAPDPRLDEAIHLLRSKQQPDGVWLLENTHPGKVHFELEEGDGHPSRWNTLRALRVLKWFEQTASLSEKPNTRLAVYGTLAPGRVNHHQLSALAGTWQRGTVNGTLLPSGWGAALGFPGLILDPLGPPVDAYLFESPDLPAHWARLDEFEGSGYQRVVTTISTKEGARSAWIYTLSEVPT